MTSVL